MVCTPSRTLPWQSYIPKGCGRSQRSSEYQAILLEMLLLTSSTFYQPDICFHLSKAEGSNKTEPEEASPAMPGHDSATAIRKPRAPHCHTGWKNPPPGSVTTLAPSLATLKSAPDIVGFSPHFMLWHHLLLSCRPVLLLVGPRLGVFSALKRFPLPFPHTPARRYRRATKLSRGPGAALQECKPEAFEVGTC